MDVVEILPSPTDIPTPKFPNMSSSSLFRKHVVRTINKRGQQMMLGGNMRVAQATPQFTPTSLLHPNNLRNTLNSSPILSTFPKRSSLSLSRSCISRPTAASRNLNQTMSSSTNASESEWNYSESDIAQKFLFFNVLKDGRVHVLCPPFATVPPSYGSSFGVSIKDVEVSSDVSARVFLPSAASTTEKLPVLLYIHGGGFCMQTASSEDYTRFCSQMAAEAKVLVVSVEYGLFPKRPIPACYDDSWTALKWVASHSNRSGPDPWINDYADVGRVFVAGDSAGGNITHTVLVKAGSMGLNEGAKVEGAILVHPYFSEDDKMWMYMCPANEGSRDPRMKPAVEDLAKTGCDRVLVLLAEKDGLYGAGKMYADELVKSGWKGKLEVMENKEKDHCFHLPNHTDLEAVAIRQRITSFIHNQA